MTLEKVGKVLKSGFGDRVVTGIILGLLEKVTPGALYLAIKNDSHLKGWDNVKKLAKDIDRPVTPEYILEKLTERRADLASIIINAPGGRDWLKKQVADFK